MSTHPFQVEELIATLNTTNIGTEALELARLQAQLQQALQVYPQGAPFPTSPVQSACTYSVGAPTNTPTARTPSGPSWYMDATHGRRRRSSSAASARPRGRQMFREEDEDHWRQGDLSRCEMDQDVMEDVEEEAQVDASLYSTTSPIQVARPSTSPTYGSSPTNYALTDPFLAAQLQAAEQRTRQPSFFAQIATAQQNTSPFYTAAQQSEQPQSGASVEAQPPHTTTSIFQTSPRPARHTLTIDTGPCFIPVDAARIR
ncbi:hypothetical protein JB92DRAFT_2999250 [Gautieria morchelliformis]|nr:hypothetical protein JB92DRAFT_2999250 [Gautieria morchelliformis]